ncbi:uncharacterized protein V6R79_018137 [Siganus canaliculatus]
MSDLLRLAAQADRRKSPTLSQLSQNDINSIWANVSEYIEHQMALHKGVHLSGLGTFTFSQQKLDLGNKCTIIQRPIFLLTGKLIQSLGLKKVKPLAAATHLPVVRLNFAAVSQRMSFSQDIVEGCIRETLQLLVRGLASEQNLLLTLQGIGVLSFKNNKVRMKFNRDFISAMDGQLLTFNHRAGSRVSSLSRSQGTRSATLPAACSPPADEKPDDKDLPCLVPALDRRKEGEVPLQTESKSHQPLQPAKKRAVNLPGELNPELPMEARGTEESVPAFRSTNPLSAAGVSVGCTDHPRAGQELCYLCMQRAQRNVPVYRREQWEAEEKAQEKLLLLREQQRDEQLMDDEQVKLNEQREHSKQIAAFNLQMSKKNKKTDRSVTHTSFLFPARPLTPVKELQQRCYRNQLQSQIDRRRQHEARDQQSRLLVEHLDQMQLVQEIALQKAQQLQQKQERTENYKRALDIQVRDKTCADPPVGQPINTRFKRCETADHDAESQQRAQKLFHINFSAAAQKKQDELQHRQEQVERERETLQHNKLELTVDSVNRFEKRWDVSKSLQDEWSRSVKLKHQREEEERRFLRSAGQLLVDKLGQYRRCCQCKRKTANCGETNIWRDSGFLSGTQFMT